MSEFRGAIVGHTESSTEMTPYVANYNFRVAICGSRSVTDYSLVLQAICEARLQGFIPLGEFIVVSGGAQGVDALAKRFSIDAGYRLIEYKPDYSTGKGRVAPLIRNSIIAENSDVLIAIHDGKSTFWFSGKTKMPCKALVPLPTPCINGNNAHDKLYEKTRKASLRQDNLE